MNTARSQQRVRPTCLSSNAIRVWPLRAKIHTAPRGYARPVQNRTYCPPQSRTRNPLCAETRSDEARPCEQLMSHRTTRHHSMCTPRIGKLAASSTHRSTASSASIAWNRPCSRMPSPPFLGHASRQRRHTQRASRPLFPAASLDRSSIDAAEPRTSTKLRAGRADDPNPALRCWPGPCIYTGCNDCFGRRSDVD